MRLAILDIDNNIIVAGDKIPTKIYSLSDFKRAYNKSQRVNLLKDHKKLLFIKIKKVMKAKVSEKSIRKKIEKIKKKIDIINNI